MAELGTVKGDGEIGGNGTHVAAGIAAEPAGNIDSDPFRLMGPAAGVQGRIQADGVVERAGTR